MAPAFWCGRCSHRLSCCSYSSGSRWRLKPIRWASSELGVGALMSRWRVESSAMMSARRSACWDLMAKWMRESSAVGAGTATAAPRGGLLDLKTRVGTPHREQQVADRGNGQRSAEQVQRNQFDGQPRLVLGDADACLQDLDQDQQQHGSTAQQREADHACGDGGVNNARV